MRLFIAGVGLKLSPCELCREPVFMVTLELELISSLKSDSRLECQVIANSKIVALQENKVALLNQRAIRGEMLETLKGMSLGSSLPLPCLFSPPKSLFQDGDQQVYKLGTIMDF